MSKKRKVLYTILIILLTGGLFLVWWLSKRSKASGYKNNPLSIEYRKENDWIGAVRPHNGNRFESFQSTAYCFRAGAIILRNYKKAGYQSIKTIIARWAPPVENNTNSYIEFVSNETGFEPSTIIDVSKLDVMYKLLKAMAKFESRYNLTFDEFSKSQAL